MTAPTSLAPRKRPTPLRRLGWLLPLAAALTACTTLRPPAQVAPATPTSWQAPLPKLDPHSAKRSPCTGAASSPMPNGPTEG